MGDRGKSGGADLKVIPIYYLALLLGVCIGPVRGVSKIVLGDRLLWGGGDTPPITQSMVFNIDDPTLFGGLEREGGVKGSITILLGHDTQILPLAIARIIGGEEITEYGNYECYRGLVTIFFGQPVKEEYNGALIADLTREDIFDTRQPKGFKWGANNRVLRPVKVEVMNFAGENEQYSIIPRNIATEEEPDVRQDANPAFIIRKLMIDRNFGAGVAQPHFNEESFRIAAQILHTEGLGITYKIVTSAQIDKLINDIQRHIDAMCFEDGRTGQMNIRLLRKPTEAELDKFPEATPANSKVTSFKLQGEELLNQIDVTFTRDIQFKAEKIQIGKDRHDLPIYRNVHKAETNRANSVTVQDIAGMTSDSGVVAEERNYLGIRSPKVAQRIAERDLLAAAYPMAYIEIDLFNDFGALSPGDILKVNSPEDSPDDPDRLFIMRVMNITESLNGGQFIRANLAEDVYSRSAPPEYATPVGEFEVDNTPPTNDYEQLPITLPYILESRAGIYEEGYVHFGVLVSTRQPGVNQFFLKADGKTILDNDTEDNLGVAQVVGKGILLTDMQAESETTLNRFYEEVLNAGTAQESLTSKDLLNISNPGEVEANSIILVYDKKTGIDEMMGIKEINDTTGKITLWRGLFDTIPRAWPPETEFLVLPEAAVFFDRTLRLGGEENAESISYKIYPINGGGVLPEDKAEEKRAERIANGEDPYVLTSRPHRPYRPANITVGGQLQTDSSGVIVKPLKAVPTLHRTNTTDGAPTSIPPALFGSYLRDPTATEDLLITWENRNRTTETAVANRWVQGNSIPEVNQRTRIDLFYFTEATGDVFIKAYQVAPQSDPANPNDPPHAMFYPRHFYIPVADMLDDSQNPHEQLLVRISSVLIDPDSTPDAATNLQKEFFTSIYSHDIRVTLDTVSGWGAYWNQPWGV